MKRWITLAVVCLIWTSAARADEPNAAERMAEATCKIANSASTATCFFVRVPATATPEERKPAAEASNEAAGARPATGAETAANESKPGAEARIFLVTAHHVFERMKGDDAVLVLRQKRADGTYRRHEVTIPVRAGGKALWTVHPAQDVAALEIKLPANVAIEPIDLADVAGDKDAGDIGFRLGKRVMELGYPAATESNHEGFPIGREGMVASEPLTPVEKYPTFLMNSATFDGDSGGPVFIERRARGEGRGGRPMVVGILTAQMREDARTHSQFEERTVHFPMSLAIVVQAKFVRETVALAAKAPTLAAKAPTPAEPSSEKSEPSPAK